MEQLTFKNGTPGFEYYYLNKRTGERAKYLDGPWNNILVDDIIESWYKKSYEWEHQQLDHQAILTDEDGYPKIKYKTI